MEENEGREKQQGVQHTSVAFEQPECRAAPVPFHSVERRVVVGIGASAGGLKALTALFDALPDAPGLTFVVITHQAPEQESHLVSLLQARTSMPVSEVRDAVPLEPNHVYVIPPGKQLVAADNVLSTVDFEEPRGQRVPIDHFFRSLATVDADRVGIILSGGGTDGSVGIKSIKEQGGVVMVQDPEEADSDSMPRSALATGVVDVVLPVKELAQRLTELSEHPIQLSERPEELGDSEADTVQKILTELRARTGHDFRQYKSPTVLRRIQRRMQVNQRTNLAEYLELMQGNRQEVEALFDELLISVTSFFRDAASYEALAHEVIPRLFEGKTENDSVRVWVVGCATGEEAYSLGMLLLEYAATLDLPPDIQIFASDISEDALNRARAGIYPPAIRADVSDERLHRFFVPEGEYYRVKRELRETILLTQHSVHCDPPFSNIDLISCRNLLIYMQRTLQSHVFDVFHYALKPRGFLFLGSSERPDGASSLFRTVIKEHHVYAPHELKGQAPRLPLLPFMLSHLDDTGASIQTETVHDRPSEATLHRQLLEEYAPPSCIVDEDGRVLHLSQTAGRYLQHPGGSLTSDVTKLVRPELQLELHSALYKAFTKGQSTVARPIQVQFDTALSHVVYLTVRPKKAAGNADGGGEHLGPEKPLALITFNEDETGEGINTLPAEGELDRQRVFQLKNDLRSTREQLNAIIENSRASNEQLKAANEELQSINEEYRSTAEELETSKEELQSVNEELETVNAELQSNLKEVSQAHGDLQNLLAATEVDTLFLDYDLRIRRYTPPTMQLFNIQESDRGRPIHHLKHRLEYDQLEEDARKVLADLNVVKREVQSIEGGWYLMHMRPYRTVDGAVDGVVLSFVEITELKTIEQKLRSARDYAEHIVDTVHEGLLVLDEDLRVKSANRSFYETFQWSAEKTIDRYLFNLGDDQWNIPRLRKALENVWQNGEILTDFEVEIEDSEHMDRRILLFNARRLHREPYILLAIEDATERKRARRELEMLNRTLEQRVVERVRQVRQLASQLTLAEQEERQRIAQILHDDLQQRLFSIEMKMGSLRRSLESGSKDGLLKEMEEAHDWTRRAIEIARQLAVDLSPPIQDGEGLADVLEWLALKMKEMHGLTVDLRADKGFRIPEEDTRVLLFQSIRELLFNVVKHAGTDRAIVEMRNEEGHLCIRIIDEGRGFDVSEVEARGGGQQRGLGLFSVRDRLRFIGGRMDIKSTPGHGTTVIIHTPVETEACDI